MDGALEVRWFGEKRWRLVVSLLSVARSGLGGVSLLSAGAQMESRGCETRMLSLPSLAVCRGARSLLAGQAAGI